jgi:YebC/PmpR family DNA-binding regulatory protein
MGRAYEVRKASMAKTAAAKSKVYARYGKEIYIIAKNGEPDPEMNTALKRVVEKAKKDQVPADVIKRAIDKAKGGGGEDYNELRYEGFGPGSATVIVDCLTDNVNRTVSEVRNCFTKTGGKLGVSGSVMHSYTDTSIVSFEGDNEEEVLEALLMEDIDVTDIENDEGDIIVYGDGVDLHKIQDALQGYKSDIEFKDSERALLPVEYVTLDEEETKSFEKLMNMLDEVDDVQKVHHNVKF